MLRRLYFCCEKLRNYVYMQIC